jgi:hypothetical protein
MALAQNTAPAAGGAGQGSHPCAQIKQACEQAGFVKGDAKEGNGLWVDCIDPIMQGKPQPKKATKALPTVSSTLIAECKAKKANWGEGKGH